MCIDLARALTPYRRATYRRPKIVFSSRYMDGLMQSALALFRGFARSRFAALLAAPLLLAPAGPATAQTESPARSAGEAAPMKKSCGRLVWGGPGES